MGAASSAAAFMAFIAFIAFMAAILTNEEVIGEVCRRQFKSLSLHCLHGGHLDKRGGDRRSVQET